MSASRFAPIFAISLLGLIAFTLFARGKDNQTLDGVYVRFDSLSEFYPGIENCPISGSAYWLVSNSEFDGYVRVRGSDLQHFFRSAWRVRITGNISRIGSYGFRGRYWREIQVSHVFHAKEIVPCPGIQ